MKISIKIIPLFTILFIFFDATLIHCETLPNDGSLTEKQYQQKGMPQKIGNPNDFSAAYQSLWQLAETDKNSLPRYNSAKSKSLFSKLFNRTHIEAVLANKLSVQKKREFLSEMRVMYSDFSGLYGTFNQDRTYDNEIVRILSLSVYAHISAIELIEKEIKENNLDLKSVYKNPQKDILLNTKMIARDLWQLTYRIKTLETYDNPTRKSIFEDLTLYRKKVNSISFLNFADNMKKIDSLY